VSWLCKIFALIVLAISCGLGGATPLREQEIELIKKYKEWEEIIIDADDPQRIFEFFYNNSHWPLFHRLIKVAEREVQINIDNRDLLLQWFRRYRPCTIEGIIIYANLLLITDRQSGELYINQTFTYQNLTTEAIKKFKSEFADYISEKSEAKFIKRLIRKRDYEKLKTLKNIFPKYMQKYINKALSGRQHLDDSDVDVDDHEQRYKIANRYVNKKSYEKAAEVLAANNNNEEGNSTKFFHLRREVACNVIKLGHPTLAYKVISKHTLNKMLPEHKQNYIKAEWLAGFYAFRFLNNKSAAIKHFRNAYSVSTDSMHKSKNAFWLGEVYLKMNDIMSSFEWYRKAYDLFNTFYGRIAEERIVQISPNKLIKKVDITDVSEDIKRSFNNREFVKLLRAISKYNIETQTKFLFPFYKKLIDEIEDPNEESLIMELVLNDDEMEYVLKVQNLKQKYFKDKKSFKKMNNHWVQNIKKINNDECFVALIHSIVKKESLFKPSARNKISGATGLMQLMPATAAYEQKKIKGKFYTGEKGTSLYDPQKNLTIGSFLVDRLLEKYDNDLIYTTAAYNAGEGNVSKIKKSLKKLKGLTPLDIIEFIPFKETRLYVKGVLYNLFCYQFIFNAETCYNCPKIIQQ
jgi:soluble lytic murein transglycosylase